MTVVDLNETYILCHMPSLYMTTCQNLREKCLLLFCVLTTFINVSRNCISMLFK
jgi:hypothetical protein